MEKEHIEVRAEMTGNSLSCGFGDCGSYAIHEVRPEESYQRISRVYVQRILGNGPGLGKNLFENPNVNYNGTYKVKEVNYGQGILEEPPIEFCISNAKSADRLARMIVIDIGKRISEQKSLELVDLIEEDIKTLLKQSRNLRKR